MTNATRRHNALRLLLALVALGLALAAPVAAATPPAAEEAKAPAASEQRWRLLATGHHQLRVGQELDPKAEIFLSASGVPRLLLVSERLEAPWLVVAGERQAMPLPADAVAASEEEADLRLVARERAGSAVPISIAEGAVRFDAAGVQVAVEPREALIGELSGASLLAEVPEYRRVAASFEPSKGTLRLLESVEEPVEVAVFFGTWCPHCERLVPRLMRLEEDLANPNLRFRFLGLPRRFSESPEARQYKIEGVPAAVVTRGGEIVAKLEGRSLLEPEESLAAVLFGGQS